MASAAQVYQREMHDRIGFFATWLPGDAIEVGDVGTLEDGRFRKFSSLKELGVPFRVSHKPNSQDLHYSSRSGASMDVAAAAAIPGIPGVSADINVKFDHSGAFLFHASKLRLEQLEDRDSVFKAMVECYQRKRWNKEWFLVESLHHADCATVIVAEEGSAGLMLKAQAPLVLGPLPLADPKVTLDFRSSHGRVTHVLAGRGLRPLYSCLRVKDGWFSDPEVVAVRGQGPDPGPAVVRASIDDLVGGRTATGDSGQ